MKQKITVSVETQYFTIVEGDYTEKEAIQIALEREPPALMAYDMNSEEDTGEWINDGVLEFTNLGNKQPDIEIL